MNQIDLEEQELEERADAIRAALEKQFVAPFAGRFSRQDLRDIVSRLWEVRQSLGREGYGHVELGEFYIEFVVAASQAE